MEKRVTTCVVIDLNLAYRSQVKKGRRETTAS